METAALLTILVKGLVAAVLAAGGVYAIVSGARLFRDGVGLKSDGSRFELSRKEFKIKVTASSVGAVLMATAGGWGWLAKETLPAASFDDGSWNVTQLEPGEIDKKSKALERELLDFASTNNQLQSRVAALRFFKAAASEKDAQIDVESISDDLAQITTLSKRLATMTKRQGDLHNIITQLAQELARTDNSLQNDSDIEQQANKTLNELETKIYQINSSAETVVDTFPSAPSRYALALAAGDYQAAAELLSNTIAYAVELATRANEVVDVGAKLASEPMT